MTLFGYWRSIASRMMRIAAPLVFVACLLVPVRNRFIDLLMVVTLLATLVGWGIALRKKPRWCAILIFVALLPVLFLALPSGVNANPKDLGAAYAQSLQRYLGTQYWWGGETALGIDCSGLVRAGMMDACLQEGVRTWNAGLCRHALDLWWHDETAKALGQGYRNLTTHVADAASLNALDPSVVQVGDLAVAGDGVHILAYLGNSRWIQADPEAGKVIIEAVPSKNPWMKGAVKIVRWNLLKQ